MKEQAARIEAAAEALVKIMDIPESSVPSELFDNAKGIAIIPGVIKVGMMVGGSSAVACWRCGGRTAGGATPCG